MSVKSVRRRDMDWEKYRRGDGSINLEVAWEKEGSIRIRDVSRPYTFIRRVERNQRIISRQVAAVVLAIADEFCKIGD